MENNSKILIVLASYNGEKYIYDQIKSILAQLDVRVHLLVFDDKSSDDTVNKINAIKDPRIEIQENIANSGSAALNFLDALRQIGEIKLGFYDYVCFSDQDDIWLEEKLKVAIDELRKNEASLYASNLIQWNAKSEQRTILKKSHKQKKYDFLFEGGSAGCTYVFTSELARQFVNSIANFNFADWKYLSHDWMLYFYARLNEHKVFIDSKSYILYRIHDSNVHGSISLLDRLKMFQNGWYKIHSLNFQKFFLKETDEAFEIYKKFNGSWLSKMGVLTKYNFELMRSKRKFVLFYFLNLITVKFD